MPSPASSYYGPAYHGEYDGWTNWAYERWQREAAKRPTPDAVFAFGSNLYATQMKFRCPSAQFVKVAALERCHLRFAGMRGVATVIRDKDPESKAYVPGVIWRVTPEDLAKMDRYEGVPTTYVARDVQVDDLLVRYYEYDSPRSFSLPSRDYLLKLVRGYKEYGFDLDLLEQAVRACR